MYPGSLPYTLPLISTAVLTIGIASHAFRRKKQLGANSFGWLMIAITEWVTTYALEIVASTMQAKTLANQLTYLGIAAAPTFWLIFALEYTGNTKWLKGRTKKVFTVWPLIVFGTTLTNDFHHLMWKSTSLAPNGLPGLIFKGYGLTFWTIVIISYIFVLAGISLYILTYLKSTRVFRQQISIMVFGSLIPLVGNVLYLTTSSHEYGLDWTPFTFALSGIFLAFGLFQYDLLNLIPLAAPMVIENLLDAVIVVDIYGRIVNLNPAAHKWLNISEEAIGRNVHDVMKGMDVIWEHWDAPNVQFQLEIDEFGRKRWFQLMISMLRDPHGNLKGRVIVARDNTFEQNALLAERRHTRQLEMLNSITHAALEGTNFQETLQMLADEMGMILEADGAFITLWNNTTKTAIPAAANGDLQNKYPFITVGPNELTLTETVLMMGHPLAIEDVFNTEYMSRTIAERFRTRSILALPLIANKEKLGAAIIAFNNLHHFTLEEISFGEQAGSQVALAIYKTQLLDDSYHRIAHLALLEEVSKLVSESLDEKEILLRTVEAVVNRFGYAQAAISMLVDSGDLEATVINGTEDTGFKPGYRQKIGEGIVGHSAELGLPYLASDIENDPYYHTIGKQKGSAVGIPLLDEGRCLGVLYVQSTKRNVFKPDDIQTLQTLITHVVTAIQKARLFAQVQDHLNAITVLQSISQTVASSLDLQNIFQTVVQLLKDSFNYPYVSIYLLDDKVMRLGAQVGYPGELIIHEIPVTSGIMGRSILTKQAQFIPNVAKDPVYLKVTNEVESEICVPLLKEGNALGVINVEASPGHPLTENDVNLMTALAGPIAIAVDNARLHSEIKSFALMDSLTKLLNRRAFDQTLSTEISRAKRYGYPLALIIIDLDNFKAYNDRWGHPAGDKRLIEIATLLKSNIRNPDVAARFGGDEFVLILPYASATNALTLAERLRKAAEAQAVDFSGSDGFISGYTISLGVATFPENGKAASDLLLAADNAELAAKRLGKNRVCSVFDFQNILKP